MPNYKLILSYDGTKYNGWQKQSNTPNTIQAKVEAVLSRLLSQEIEIAASGRTDAGVHARMQVCSFHAKTEMACGQILRGIREYLPEDIGAMSLDEVQPRFHARLNCREKTYVYRIRRSIIPDVFRRKYVYTFTEALDLEKMRSAASLLCGTHDFTSFNSNRHFKKSAVRTVSSINIEETDDELRLSFTGDGFLYNMVRIMVGTLIEVGQGKRTAESIGDTLDAMNRETAGFTAPAQGLILWEVRY